MKNFKKRILSGALAGALAVSMAVPAFASNSVLTATYQEPVITVTVPQTGDVVINPFGMPVKVGEANSKDVNIVGAQIVTKPLAIVNTGTTDLKVSASVTTETKGDLRIATSKPSSSDTTKSAYVYLQMANSTLNKNNEATGGATDAIAGLAGADVAEAVAAWEQRAYTSSTDLLLSGTAAAAKDNMLTLKSVDAAGDIQAGSVGLFRLAGQVVASPREAWATADGFTATVAFSFRPDFTAASINEEAVTVKASASATPHTAELAVTLDGATITGVEWASDDDTKATVTADTTDNTKATVTGIAAGTTAINATITASNGLTYTVTCNVTVE